MPKRKETKATKTKTSKIIKSAIAKGKGIAQNQSVVVNILKEKIKAKRTYRRKQKQPTQVFPPVGIYSIPMINAIPPPPQFNQINAIPPPPLFNQINPFPGAGYAIGLPTDNQLSINTIHDGSVSPMTSDGTFDNANRSNDFLNNPFDNTALKTLNEDDMEDIAVRKTIYRKKQNPLGKSPEQITPENAPFKTPRKANRPKEVILREKSEANKRRLVREEQKIERDLQRITNEQEKLLKKNTPKKPPFL